MRPVVSVLLTLFVLLALGGLARADDPAPAAPAKKAPAVSPGKPTTPKPSTKASDTTVPTKRPGDREIGEALWKQSCSQCHGATGLGDGPAAEAMPGGVPDILGTLTEESLDRMVTVVQEGRGRMPAYSETIDRADSRRVLQYLLDRAAGKGAAAAPAEPDEEEAAGDAEAGGGQ